MPDRDPSPEKQHDPQANHERLQKALAEGRSVLHAGRLITREADLPSAADIEKHASARATTAVAALEERIAELSREKDRLLHGSAAGTSARGEGSARGADAPSGRGAPAEPLPPGKGR